MASFGSTPEKQYLESIENYNDQLLESLNKALYVLQTPAMGSSDRRAAIAIEILSKAVQ
jgi:hypothetical protein